MRTCFARTKLWVVLLLQDVCARTSNTMLHLDYIISNYNGVKIVFFSYLSIIHTRRFFGKTKKAKTPFDLERFRVVRETGKTLWNII